MVEIFRLNSADAKKDTEISARFAEERKRGPLMCESVCVLMRACINGEEEGKPLARWLPIPSKEGRLPDSIIKMVAGLEASMQRE